MLEAARGGAGLDVEPGAELVGGGLVARVGGGEVEGEEGGANADVVEGEL